MVKYKPRYQTPDDIPADQREFYVPEDPAKKDGPHVFGAFDPDPDGYGIGPVGRLQATLKRLEADKRRADERMVAYRKPDAENGELYTPEEIAELAQQIADLRAQANSKDGKIDLDLIRKQTADAVSKEHEKRLRQHELRIAEQQKRAAWYEQQHRAALQTSEIDAAISALRVRDPKYVPLLRSQLEQALMVESEEHVVDGIKVSRYGFGVRGQNGEPLIDAKGAKRTLADYARTEVMQRYPEFLQAEDRSTGTGIKPAKTTAKATGNFRLLKSEALADFSKMEAMQARAKAAGDEVTLVDG